MPLPLKQLQLLFQVRVLHKNSAQTCRRARGHSINAPSAKLIAAGCTGNTTCTPVILVQLNGLLHKLQGNDNKCKHLPMLRLQRGVVMLLGVFEDKGEGADRGEGEDRYVAILGIKLII